MGRAAFEGAVRLSERERERERIRKVICDIYRATSPLQGNLFSEGYGIGWNRALDSLEEKLKD